MKFTEIFISKQDLSKANVTFTIRIGESVKTIIVPVGSKMLKYCEDEERGGFVIAYESPEEPAKEPCNHIIGYEEGVYEAWLCYADRGFNHDPPYDGDDVRFNFCPLCGVKLHE